MKEKNSWGGGVGMGEILLYALTLKKKKYLNDFQHHQ